MVVEQNQRTPQLYITQYLCGAVLGAAEDAVLVVLALGRGEGAVAIRSCVCVVVAVEESSFSRAGEWHRWPGHSAGTRNRCWRAVLQPSLC